MKTLKILDLSKNRFFSTMHPFHKWKKQLRENGIKVEFCYDHKEKYISNCDYLLIHSRYFQWQDIFKRNSENEAELINFLTEAKKSVGKLIWFDGADSSGSSDFPIISYVDTFLKKQVLKDLDYYTDSSAKNDVRIWRNTDDPKIDKITFQPCPIDQVHKIKVGWNIGLNDYRYYGKRFSRLSNYLSYTIYPLKYSSVRLDRGLDLTFRGTVHNDEQENLVTCQRHSVLKLLPNTNLNSATGKIVPKKQFWKELRNSKVSVSPFGLGEVCYRDFETAISGSLLIKPSMEHLNTYPNIFIPNETYIPVAWDLDNFKDILESSVANYSSLNHIAQNGQELYKKIINDSNQFVNAVKIMLN